MKLRILVFLLLSLILWTFTQKNNPKPSNSPRNEEITYLLDIAFGNEFGTPYTAIRKWATDIKVFLPETQYEVLNEELTKIINELNALSTSIKISQVQNQAEANFIIFLGNKDSYVANYEPKAKDFVNKNWGLFHIYWNEKYEIYKGNMYVDVIRVRNLKCQKHLLREELTQALGLMNDSNKYQKSIFYQKWTCYPAYNELDTQIIKYFLNSKIEAGMSKDQVIEVVKTL